VKAWLAELQITDVAKFEAQLDIGLNHHQKNSRQHVQSEDSEVNALGK